MEAMKCKNQKIVVYKILLRLIGAVEQTFSSPYLPSKANVKESRVYFKTRFLIAQFLRTSNKDKLKTLDFS